MTSLNLWHMWCRGSSCCLLLPYARFTQTDLKPFRSTGPVWESTAHLRLDWQHVQKHDDWRGESVCYHQVSFLLPTMTPMLCRAGMFDSKIWLCGVLSAFFYVAAVAVRAVLGRQWLPNTSWVTFPKYPEEDRKCRYRPYARSALYESSKWVKKPLNFLQCGVEVFHCLVLC